LLVPTGTQALPEWGLLARTAIGIINKAVTKRKDRENKKGKEDKVKGKQSTMKRLKLMVF
jgi:hypothetical protein